MNRNDVVTSDLVDWMQWYYIDRRTSKSSMIRFLAKRNCSLSWREAFSLASSLLFSSSLSSSCFLSFLFSSLTSLFSVWKRNKERKCSSVSEHFRKYQWRENVNVELQSCSMTDLFQRESLIQSIETIIAFVFLFSSFFLFLREQSLHFFYFLFSIGFLILQWLLQS